MYVANVNTFKSVFCDSFAQGSIQVLPKELGCQRKGAAKMICKSYLKLFFSFNQPSFNCFFYFISRYGMKEIMTSHISRYVQSSIVNVIKLYSVFWGIFVTNFFFLSEIDMLITLLTAMFLFCASSS